MDIRLEKLQLALSSAVAGMSAEDLGWHPPGKWCAAEVLEHLYLTYRGTVRGFERVAETGKSLASAPTFAQRWRTLIVVGVGYFPEGWKSPAIVEPRGLPREKVAAELAAKIVEMDAVITRCEQEVGPEEKLLDHPILGPLTAAQWRKFHLVHGLHHARQIRGLRRASKASSS